MMKGTLYSELGHIAGTDDFKYDWQCGPDKMQMTTHLSPSEALGWARMVGRKIILYVGEDSVWHGFLTKIEFKSEEVSYSSSVSDVKNHFFTNDGAIINAADSINRHGLLSAKLDNPNMDTSIIAMPVIRGNLPHIDTFGARKGRVVIQGEGPLSRLNRIIYRNTSHVIAGSGGQVRLGPAEPDSMITQPLIDLPFDSNFVSLTYRTEGSPTSATLEVLDSTSTIIASTSLFPSSEYANISFPTQGPMSSYEVRVWYAGGTGAYIISVADNAYLTQDGVPDVSPPVKAMALNIRYNAPLSVISAQINAYQPLVGVRMRGGAAFLDSGGNRKLGDYLTSSALANSIAMSIYHVGFNYYIDVSDDRYGHAPAPKNMRHYVPKYARQVCLSPSNILIEQGFVISNWYGKVGASYRRGDWKVSYS